MQLSLCLISSIIADTRFQFHLIFSISAFPISTISFDKNLNNSHTWTGKHLHLKSGAGRAAKPVLWSTFLQLRCELGMCLALESLRELLCLKHRELGRVILGSGSLCWGRPYPKKHWIRPLGKALKAEGALASKKIMLHALERRIL